MVHKERLQNGLTVLFEEVPAVRSASIGVWLRLGSRHESEDQSGICHFIEHLVFKGTTSRSARDISLLTDRIGGNLDAFTTKEMTCFLARVLDEHLPVAVDLLGDIVLHPKFDGEELERERGVILEEIRMVLDSPEDRVYDLFCERFWPDHPLGRPIQGTEETVGGMSRATVAEWFKHAYVPQNLIVSLAGHIDEGHRAIVRETFSKLPSGTPVAPGDAPDFVPGVVTENRQDVEQVHLLLGLAGLPAGHDDRYTMHMLNTILGGSISSRLFQKVREEHGLAYAISSQLHSYRGAGLLVIYAGTSPGNVEKVLSLTTGELRRMAADGPGKEDVEVARDHLKGNMLLALESTTSRMSRAAREEMILGRHQTADEIVERLDAIDPAHIRDLAGRILGGQEVALAAVGKTNGITIDEKELAL